MFKLYTIWIFTLFLVFSHGSVYSEDSISITKITPLEGQISLQIIDNTTALKDNNSALNITSTPKKIRISNYDIAYYSKTYTGYQSIVNKLAKGSDFLEAFVPDDYLKMHIPNSSNDPYTRYQMTFFKDSSQSTDITLSASNFLLDAVIGSLTDDIISFNLNSLDIIDGGFSIKIKPVSWLKIILDTYDSKFLNSKLKLEFKPTSNVALLFTRSDNITEVRSGFEVQLYF